MTLPNFPNNPTLGQQFTVSNATYECIAVASGTTKPVWKVVNQADKSLRADLASVNSPVLISGVEANKIAGYFLKSTGGDDSAAISTALATYRQVYLCDAAYSVSNVTIPDGAVLDIGASVVTKRDNGYVFSMGKRSTLTGGGVIDGNASGGKTGASVVISVGDNTPTVANQGRQLIENITFKNSDSYHIEYIVANKGWMSRLLYNNFVDMPTNAPAMVRWPDEDALGGNRTIHGGYSAGPVCNVGGADNGIITEVTVGSSSGDVNRQAVYFPASTTYPPKKIIISNNRLAIENKKMLVRGIDHVIEGNVIAGDIELQSGTSGCVVGPNIYATNKKLIDSSSAVNEIYETWQTYTPAIVSGITLGNGTFSAEYKRDGDYVDFRMKFTLGSTTTITGAMTFGLPVPVVSGSTQKWIGQAIGGAGYTGTVLIEPTQITIYNNSSLAVWNATVPFTWTNGNELNISGRYRI